MKYTERAYALKEDLERARKLLEVDNIEEMSEEELEEIGASYDDNIPLFAVTFENGNTLVCDVNSGSHNYYDDAWMECTDGNVIVYDCSYEIPNEMEFYDNDGNTYVITIIEEESED